MVRRKEKIKPVVAKPLNDTEKRSIITNFVTGNITDNETNIDINNDTQDENNNDTRGVTNTESNNETNFNKDDDTKNVSNKDTNVKTKNDKKNVTKVVPKKIMITKSIIIGKKDIVAKFTSNKKQRPNYNLSEDTIEKIEKVSEILGYKKAEFVDIYLNGTLEKILKDLEKSEL